ncbi:two-component sensor histidine kinase [Nonomuraea phyllanthi]|uniref:histidine kinase n=1 Tax=Nonomuraea phyllanthi TaxID=2219224 RepID=UPI00129381EE|nr:histidine kinase [Nonomuraea phyllanthi]QFY09894.1 two-component sensor histidine kinase [Nonomuraea phyllanthi]
MRRMEPNTWAGLVVFLMAVAVGAPTLLGLSPTVVPRALWTTLFVGLLAGLMFSALWEETGLWPARIAHVLSVVLGWAVVLTAPRAGWLPILLIFTAAMAAYVLPAWAGPVLIALNTGVIGLTASLLSAPGDQILLNALLYLLIQSATLLSTTAIIREQRMRRELAEAHVELRAASTILADTTRAHERLRIARELHDLIGHQLSALALELEVARHHEGAEAHEHVERANAVARELLGDVRKTVGQLRADAPDLRESLTAVVRDIPGLDISVRIDDDVQAGEELTETLIRVVQEIVTNTIRHAAATTLRIRIETMPDHAVRLTSVDDGRGSPDVRPGNGLRGLAERIGAMGGDVRLDGSNGFRITATVPAR